MLLYGNVCYDTQEAAEEAINMIHGMKICVQQVFVEHEIEASHRLTDTLLVMYIPTSLCTEEDGREIFAEYGPLISVRVQTHYDSVS